MLIIIIALIFVVWFNFYSPWSAKEINKEKAKHREEIFKREIENKSIREKEVEILNEVNLKKERRNQIDDTISSSRRSVIDIGQIYPELDINSHSSIFEEFISSALYELGVNNPKYNSDNIPIENLNTLLSIFSSTRNLYNSCFQFNTQGLDGDMEELDISKFRKDFLYSKNTNIVGILTLIKGYNLVAKKYVSYLENELELKDDFFLIQNLKPNLS